MGRLRGRSWDELRQEGIEEEVMCDEEGICL
jgi:hypothetical protein